MKRNKLILITSTICICFVIAVIAILVISKKSPKTKQLNSKANDTIKKTTSLPSSEDILKDADMQSGTKKAFEKHFKVNFKDYTSHKKIPYGKIKKITYPSKVIGEKREAYIYTPADYSSDKTYPVLYLFHGIGCDGQQWVSMNLNEIISNMIASKEVVPFIAVCPSIIPPKAERTPDETLSASNIAAYSNFKEEFLKDLEPFIQKNYSVSTNRKDVGVCGLSMGGMESLSLGFSCLDHFNYIGSFSGAPSLDTSLLSVKESKYTPDLVMLSSGDKDFTVGKNPYNYHMELKKNHIAHIWFQYPGGAHSGDVWQNGLINFLKRSFKAN